MNLLDMSNLRYEERIAIKEGYRSEMSDAYFAERPEMWDKKTLKAFEAGFDRAWDLFTNSESPKPIKNPKTT